MQVRLVDPAAPPESNCGPEPPRKPISQLRFKTPSVDTPRSLDEALNLAKNSALEAQTHARHLRGSARRHLQGHCLQIVRALTFIREFVERNQ